MTRNLKLLVLEGKVRPRDRRLGPGINRAKALTAISEAGAKVRHDSGGRLLVIEAPARAEKELRERLPEARLVAVDADVKDELSSLDETESLFLDALKLRMSKSFRDAKRRRKYGETPEEKELFSGSCVREEY